MTPAVRLREELQERRRQGQSFSEAWPDALGVVLDALPEADRETWAYTWDRQQLQAWRAGYERQATRGIHETLLTLSEGSSARSLSTLVA